MKTIEKLYEEGNAQAAFVLRKLVKEESRTSKGNYKVRISDGNDEAYNTGLASYLMDRCDYVNTNWGFIAFVP